MIDERDSPEPVVLTPQQRQILDARLAGSRVPRAKPTWPARPEWIPLSDFQLGLWLLDQQASGSAQYNLVLALPVDGAMAPAVVAAAVDALVARHESLRTRFVAADGQPAQVIDPPSPAPLPTHDLTTAPQPAAALRALVRTLRHAPFDLAAGPVQRAMLVQRAAAPHVLLWALHHIVVDGWSEQILRAEWPAALAAAAARTPLPLPPLPVQYADFALWQRAQLSDTRLATLLAYWTAHLHDAPPDIALPTRPRPARLGHAGDALHLALSPAQTAAVRALADQHGTTLYMALLAVFGLLLARYTGQWDLVLGVPLAYRPRPEFESLVGFCVNTLPVRWRAQPHDPFTTLLATVRAATLGALAHQDLPFERLVAALQPLRRHDRSPLFHVTFALQQLPRIPATDQSAESIRNVRQLERQTEVHAREQAVRFDLEVHVWELGGAAGLSWIYNRELFERGTVERMSAHFLNLIDEVIARPDAALCRLRLGPPPDLIAEPIGPVAVNIVDAFEAQAARTPDAPALFSGAERIDYRQLDERANALARTLIERGIGPEKLVGIVVPRSAGLVIAELAVLKTGAAFLALDPEQPSQRISLLLQEANIQILVADAALAPGVTSPGVERLEPDLTQRADRQTRCAIDARHPAYVIYTSGSTGRPKGVAVTHGALAMFVATIGPAAQMGPRSRHIAIASVMADVAVLDLLMPLCSGALVAVATSEQVRNVARLASLARDITATSIHFTPSYARLMLEHQREMFAGLRLLAGGEPMDPTLAGALLDAGCDVWNLYGPAETAVVTSFAHVTRADVSPHHTIGIGSPVAGTQMYVLDPWMQPLPVGVRGELYIAGEQLARGYWHRSGLTASRFVASPFGPAGSRLYRTGDLAQQRSDGTLEFCGRVDDQVKIRAFRVEPGEVEARLREHALVSEAVVIAQRSDQDVTLAAYVLAADDSFGREEIAARLQEYLRAHLPDFMVPAGVTVLDAWPLTSSGKLDRLALPRQESAVVAGSVAPRTVIEQAVHDIFTGVLRAKSLGIDDDFFAVGGHSLAAMQVIARVQSRFDVTISVADFFKSPTIAHIARAIASRTQGAETPLVPFERPGRVPATFAQEQLWFLDQQASGSAQYNLVLALPVDGAMAPAVVAAAVDALVARHESLRTRFVAADGQPAQVIDPPSPAPLPTHDLTTAPQPAAALRALVRTLRHAPFDLAAGPVQRAMLVQRAAAPHVLLWALHHIVVDGWSEQILRAEWPAALAAAAARTPLPLPPLPVQYADFALWQRAQLSDTRLATLLAYWTAHLHDAPPDIALPTRPRPARLGHAGDALHLALSPAQTAAVRALADQHGTTLYMALLAVFGLLLARYTGQWDLVLGVPLAYRPRPEFESLVGFCVNTLPVRWRAQPHDPFTTLLATVRAATLGALAHQDLPFERLVAALQPLRRHDRSPLFHVTFALQQLPRIPAMPSSHDEQDETRSIRSDAGDLAHEGAMVRFDLQVYAWDLHGATGMTWMYNTALFEREWIERMAGHYSALVDSVIADPARQVGRIPMLDDAEATRILRGWNATDTPRSTSNVLDSIYEQAARTPSATALVSGIERCTYAVMLARANALALDLTARGIGPESVVAVAVDRSVSLVVAELAVLIAGAAFLAIDPRHPAPRVSTLLREAGVTCAIVGLGAEEQPLPDGIIRIVMADPNRDLPTSQFERPPNAVFAAAHPAYVLYTSGTTGLPKGVAVSHSALAAFADAIQPATRFRSGELHVAITNVMADVAILDLIIPLCTGATVVVATAEESRNPLALSALIRRMHPTSLHLTPSYARLLIDHDPAMLRGLRLFVGGEQLELELAAALRGVAADVWNFYGPAEATVVTSFQAVDDRALSGERGVSIGVPVANTQMYVLDASLLPVPVGVPGELYIAGAQLARGYRGRGALTASRFIANPFGLPGSRLYRTGDSVQWAFDGRLEFLGRTDGQVKLRANRVEVGEVEAVVRRQDGVRDAAVIARDHDGGVRLVAYVLPAKPTSGAPPLETALRDSLRAQLPDFMVPSAIVVLDEWPLTPNGKLDRRALPEPAPVIRRNDRVPQSPIEELLLGLFRSVLRHDRVGLTDDFFALGGHSLMAMQLIVRLQDVFDVSATVADVFSYPTVELLAGRIDALRAGSRAAVSSSHRRPFLAPAPNERVAASPGQRFVWATCASRGGWINHNMVAALRLDGPCDLSAVSRAATELRDRQQALRTRVVPGDDGLWQVVDAPDTVPVEHISLTHLDAGARVDSIREIAGRERRTLLSLERGPLLRLCVVTLDADRHVLFRTAHHLTTDGWSDGIFEREFRQLYAAHAERRAVTLPKLEAEYAHFAAWQNANREADVGLHFWIQQLDPASQNTPLPRRGENASSMAIGRRHHQLLGSERSAAVLAVQSRSHATLYMALLAGLSVLVWRRTGATRIVVASPMANRPTVAFEGVIGMFVNTVPMAVDIVPGESFDSLLSRVRQTFLDALSCQHIASPLMDGSTSPPFQRPAVWLGVFNVPQAPAVEAVHSPAGLAPLDLAGIVNDGDQPIRFPLELHAWQGRESIGISWLYDRDLWTEANVRQWADALEATLDAVLARPSSALEEVLPNEADSFTGRVKRSEGSRVPASSPAEPADHIRVISRSKPLPLSFNQEKHLAQRWLARNGREPAVPFQARVTIQFSVPPDVDVVERTISYLANRHEVFRTAFVPVGRLRHSSIWGKLSMALFRMGRVRAVVARVALRKTGTPRLFKQHITARARIPVAEYNWRALSPKEQQEKRQTLQEVTAPFDLAKAPLARAALIHIGAAKSELIIVVHHLLFDKRSAEVLDREFRVVYEAMKAGRQPEIPALSIQFADFAAWEREKFSGQDLDRYLDFWERQLPNFSPVASPVNLGDLPFHRLPARDTYRANSLTVSLGAELSEAVVRLAEQRRITLFSLLFAALATLLHNLTRRSTIGVWAFLANRTRPETQDVIGWFAQKHLLSLPISGDMRFEDVAQGAHALVLGAIAHQELPLALFSLRKRFEISDRDLVSMPHVTFDLTTLAARDADGIDAASESGATDTGRTDMGLGVHALQRGAQLTIEFRFNQDWLAADDVAQMLRDYVTLLRSAEADVSAPVHRLMAYVASVRASGAAPGVTSSGG